MTKSIFIANTEGKVGKSAIALGLIEALAREVGSVGIFRPMVKSVEDDHVTKVMLSQPAIDQEYEDAVGLSYEQVFADPDEAMTQIVQKFGALSGRYDAVVILGSDYTDVSQATEFAMNVQIAANLNSPALIAVRGSNTTPESVLRSAKNAVAEFESRGVKVIGVLAARVEPDQVEETAEALKALDGKLTGAIPEDPLLNAPSVRDQFAEMDAKLIIGQDRMLDRESMGVIVAGMTLPNLLNRLEADQTLLMASDRAADLIPGLILAQQSGAFPRPAGVIMLGDYEMPESVSKLLASVDSDLPIATAQARTFDTAKALAGLEGIRTSSPRKVEHARRLYEQYVDGSEILRMMDLPRAQLRTPVMFQYQIMQKARADRKRIVLPESEDMRILESTSILLQRDVADLILLGEEAKIRADAAANGWDLTGATIISVNDPERADRYAEKYAELRAKKGVNLAMAKDRMTDSAYFGTMMVYLGEADGLVSGAAHTTANTIRPALEFIKTKPGVSVVSGAFLMSMSDRVLVFADCAVTPDPTAQQLADIAISSVATARAFDVEPRVAMLSYSTGDSGTGADVDKVREATELVLATNPDFPIAGPIQFDAAIDPTVGKAKMPDSEVAGQATVFIFPDLNTGNNTYKAVQRTSGALAVGPVLQGLNKPVNDLSRGALVDDIVNTVAITAIQAQGN